jgi:hypothetical protein
MTEPFWNVEPRLAAWPLLRKGLIIAAEGPGQGRGYSSRWYLRRPLGITGEGWEARSSGTHGAGPGAWR